MSLPVDVENKIMNLGKGQAVNRGFLDIYKALVNESDMDGAPAKTLVFPFYDRNSKLKPGDWAAELHFVIRKVESVDE